MDEVVDAIVVNKGLVISENEVDEVAGWFDPVTDRMLENYVQLLIKKVKEKSGQILRVASDEEIQKKFAFRVKGSCEYFILEPNDHLTIGPYLTVVEMANKKSKI